MSASGSSEDMALVKKLNALEVENKQLKKGDKGLFTYYVSQKQEFVDPPSVTDLNGVILANLGVPEMALRMQE